ncbi:MAG: GLPGLI family protein [Flavisolibacter sp.]
MKKFIASIGLLVSFFAQAQVKEGKIIYERVMQLPTRMLNIDPSIAAQIPKSRTDQYELLFGNNQSLYQFLPNINNEDQSTFSGGGGTFVMRFAGNNDIVFHNFLTQTKIEQREVMDRSFLVTDSIRKLNWKLTDETKTILNYKVQKATTTRISTRPRMTMENGQMKREEFPDTAKILVWFTTDIPVPAGPDFQGQLPGAILEVDIDNGQTIYKAIEFSNKVSLNKIKEPKDGKKVTAAEFTKERDKLMEEMRKNMPNGSIRIQQ